MARESEHIVHRGMGLGHRGEEGVGTVAKGTSTEPVTEPKAHLKAIAKRGSEDVVVQ
jgi:hypothetical protein